MSVSLVLIPLAVAAVAAWQASQTEVDEHGNTAVQVGTRMRRPELLQEALVATGATVREEQGALIADWIGVQARFTVGADGIWSAHLTGDVDEARAVGIVQGVDVAYGKAVQQAVVQRLQERAPLANMTVESQTVEQDQSVTMVLNVGAGR